MSKKDDIIKYAKEHPKCTVIECCNAVGSKPEYVRKIFRKIGYKATVQRPDKLKYKEGDYIGKGVLFNKRLDKDTGIFICPYDGEKFIAKIGNVASGKTSSCGCHRIPTFEDKVNFQDLTGRRFGKLTVLYRLSNRNKDNRVIWHCVCDCGRFKNVPGKYLKDGSTTSCGCLCSKGEEAIKQFLDSAGIEYEHQKTFTDCVNPQTNWNLIYDFYLPKYNTCIEFDGEQHFHKTGGYFAKETTEQIQYRDVIKTQYCIDHRIPLYRISYLEYDNIDNRMGEILKELQND